MASFAELKEHYVSQYGLKNSSAFDSVFEKEDAEQHQDYYISKWAQENELIYYDVRNEFLCILKDLDNFESDPLDFSCARVRKWVSHIRA